MIRSGPALSALAAAAVLAGCAGTQVRASADTAGTRDVSGAAGTAARSTTVRGTASTSGEASSAQAPIVPVVSIELYQPLASYRLYVNRLLARLRPQLRALHAAAARNDRAAAEEDWVAAHASWLEVGQDDDAYGAFGQLGEQIDGTAVGLPGTTSNPGFTGFHRVELDLWREHDPAAAAADSAKLLSLVAKLEPALVSKDLPTSATALDSWVLRCHEIMEDALRDSLSQDDDYGSNSDLASLAADVSATREMLAVLAPLIASRRPRIVSEGSRDLRAIDEAIQSAGGPLAGRNLATLPRRRRDAVDQATGAALEVLAPVSELMQVSVPGS